MREQHRCTALHVCTKAMQVSHMQSNNIIISQDAIAYRKILMSSLQFVYTQFSTISWLLTPVVQYTVTLVANRLAATHFFYIWYKLEVCTTRIKTCSRILEESLQLPNAITQHRELITPWHSLTMRKLTANKTMMASHLV